MCFLIWVSPGYELGLGGGVDQQVEVVVALEEVGYIERRADLLEPVAEDLLGHDSIDGLGEARLPRRFP